MGQERSEVARWSREPIRGYPANNRLEAPINVVENFVLLGYPSPIQ